MPVSVRITFQGLEETIARLTEIEGKAGDNLVKQAAALAKDTESYWKQVTPRGKTGRLQEGDRVEPSGLSFRLNNVVRYYGWVDEGHNTPRGWRTKHGYRLAKRRSHVAGREMTPKTIEFIKQNMPLYLAKFLDNV